MTTQTTPENIAKCRQIVSLYFQPWGAAKAAMWEDLVGDCSFNAENALRKIGKLLEIKDDTVTTPNPYWTGHNDAMA